MSILMHGSEKALVLKEKFMAEVSEAFYAVPIPAGTAIRCKQYRLGASPGRSIVDVICADGRLPDTPPSN